MTLSRKVESITSLEPFVSELDNAIQACENPETVCDALEMMIVRRNLLRLARVCFALSSRILHAYIQRRLAKSVEGCGTRKDAFDSEHLPKAGVRL
jgi:hypothetical protein